jgi:hypothetical protein
MMQPIPKNLPDALTALGFSADAKSIGIGRLRNALVGCSISFVHACVLHLRQAGMITGMVAQDLLRANYGVVRHGSR